VTPPASKTTAQYADGYSRNAVGEGMTVEQEDPPFV